MPDVYSKEIRSYTMSRIRKTNTKPELLVRSFLFRNGFRFRVHVKKLPGNPDIVLSKYKTVIFVNGCFWHAHTECRFNQLPKSRQEYWIPKIARNVQRDRQSEAMLKENGWNVLTVWECDLRKTKVDATLLELIKKLKSLYK